MANSTNRVIGNPRAQSIVTLTEMTTMKFVRAITTAAVLLLSGALVVGYANQDQQKERRGKSEKSQATQKQHVSTSVRGQQPQHERVQQTRRPQQQHRTRQQEVAWQQQRGWLRHGGWQGHATWQQNRARRWETEHRTWPQRGGCGGYYTAAKAIFPASIHACTELSSMPRSAVQICDSPNSLRDALLDVGSMPPFLLARVA